MLFSWKLLLDFEVKSTGIDAISNISYYSVAKSSPILCDPMDCSTPGFSVLHLPVCSNSCPLSWWCHQTISSSVVPFSSCPQSFPASGSFPVSQLFALGGQSIGVSALVSVLPMNIQGWFPLGWTGLISLQSKGLSSVFSNTTDIYVCVRVRAHTYTHTHTRISVLVLYIYISVTSNIVNSHIRLTVIKSIERFGIKGTHSDWTLLSVLSIKWNYKKDL